MVAAGSTISTLSTSSSSTISTSCSRWREFNELRFWDFGMGLALVRVRAKVMLKITRQIPIVDLGRSTAEHAGVPEFGSDSHLRVTVLFTTTKGTLAALRTAGGLAKNLGARIALVVT